MLFLRAYCSLIVWLTLSSTRSWFSLAFAPRAHVLPHHRQSRHCCFAHKKSKASRSQQSTQSFAISVDSTSTAAPTTVAEADAVPSPTAAYLEPPPAEMALLPDMTRDDYEELLRKTVNALILTISFGSAIYAILNIDAGMTRGWTQSVRVKMNLR